MIYYCSCFYFPFPISSNLLTMVLSPYSGCYLGIYAILSGVQIASAFVTTISLAFAVVNGVCHASLQNAQECP